MFLFDSVTEDRPQDLCPFKITEYPALRGPAEVWSLTLMRGLRFTAFPSLLSNFVYLNIPAPEEHLEIYPILLVLGSYILRGSHIEPKAVSTYLSTLSRIYKD